MLYYDNKNGIIIDELPKNSIGPNGQFYINFDITNNINLWADHGYFSVRNDIPVKPFDCSIEDISKRIVTIDYPYADIMRTWIKNESPKQEIYNPLVISKEQNVDAEL